MKTKSLQLLTAAVLAGMGGMAFAAPVSITTPTFTYTQNFTALGTTTVAAFTNDSTIPGWYAQINNGTTANGAANASDGSGTVLSGLLNLGTASDADRALGSKATGTGGFANIAYAVSFKNDSGKAVKITSLNYTGELWRTNSNANQTENYTTFWQVSPAAVTNIISGVGANFGATVGGSGFTAFGSGANWTLANAAAAAALNGNLAANRLAVSFAPPTDIVVPPGQFLMVKWTDSNEAGTDGYQGIDDVSVSFAEVPFIQPTVGTATRNTQGTGDPSDDTFSFPVTVTTSSTSATGWTSDSTPASGSFGGAGVTFGPFPAAAAQTINFTTVGHAGAQLTSSITVNAPAAPIWVGQNQLGSPETPILIATGGSPAWFQVPATQSIEIRGGGGTTDQVVSTVPITLTPGTEKCVSLEIEYQDDSTGSNAETEDNFLVELVTDAGTQNLIQDLDLNGDGRMNGAAAATWRDDEFNPNSLAWSAAVPGPAFVAPDTGKFTQAWMLSAVISSTAMTASIRITAVNGTAVGTGSEHLRVRGIRLRPCVDTDGDGVNDAAEEVAGTDIGDPADLLQYSALPDLAGDTLTVFVQSASSRNYQLESTDDLVRWFRSPLAPQPGSGGELEFLNDGTLQTRRFVKVRAILPPVHIP